MESDICKCKATRGDHEALAARMAAALKARGKNPVDHPEPSFVTVGACDRFELDRRATYHAEKARKARGDDPDKRYCTLLTGCTTCGTKGSVTYVKVEGRYMHAGCPGPGAAKPPSMDKSGIEAPR